MHILTVDDSAGIRKPVMRRIGPAGIADGGSTEACDALARSRAIEARTFDLILVDVVEGHLEKSFTPERTQSTIGPFLK